jgi:hypothetical protein
MTRFCSIVAIVAGACAWSLAGQVSVAQAQTDAPAAIIEDIKASGVNYEILEVLAQGTKIALGETGTLRLAYLRSCVVEDVQGGTVVVGELESEIEGGVILAREKVNCDGGGIVPTERQGQDVAGVVFRAPDVDYDKPVVMVYATSPILAFATPATQVRIERIDPDQSDSYEFAINGRHLDLGERHVALVPGGLYRATTENGKVLFRISRRATDASTSAISRLVRF